MNKSKLRKLLPALKTYAQDTLKNSNISWIIQESLNLKKNLTINNWYLCSGKLLLERDSTLISCTTGMSRKPLWNKGLLKIVKSKSFNKKPLINTFKLHNNQKTQILLNSHQGNKTFSQTLLASINSKIQLAVIINPIHRCINLRWIWILTDN